MFADTRSALLARMLLVVVSQINITKAYVDPLATVELLRPAHPQPSWPRRQACLSSMMIDAHRATDANLQVARDAADSVTLVKFHYITGMTHELRAPLNGILVHSQILLTIKGYADVSERIVPGQFPPC